MEPEAVQSLAAREVHLCIDTTRVFAIGFS
jgi:hypothetical protein